MNYYFAHTLSRSAQNGREKRTSRSTKTENFYITTGYLYSEWATMTIHAATT